LSFKYTILNSVLITSYLYKNWISIFWFLLTALAIAHIPFSHSNNYLIFKYVFYHLKDLQNLYLEYPDSYYDSNHYGPVFALVIAPFTIFPDSIGLSLWVLMNSLILYFAILQIPIEKNARIFIILLCSNELMTSLRSSQFNPMMAALIILTFCFIQQKKESWAAFCIVLGTLIKLYGIVGLAFFFFVDDKKKFIISLAAWSAILFVLPMAISSPHFVITSYKDWYQSLVHKNDLNIVTMMQDISVGGFIRKVFNYPELPTLWVLIPGILIYSLSFLSIKYYKDLRFRLLILASTLMFPVLFSSGSESPTYIIAFTGVALWFMVQDRPYSRTEWALLIFAIILTSLSPTDLFPRYINRTYVQPYHLKALPCLLIWLRIVYNTLTMHKYVSVNTDLVISNRMYSLRETL
jgi:hypothetical protein